MKYVEEKFHIIVIDNNSQNESLQHIFNHFHSKNKCVLINHEEKLNQKLQFQESSILLIQAGLNLGYAKGNNIGIDIFKKLNTKYLLILNNDIIFTEDPFKPLIEGLLENKKRMIAGPLIKKPDGSIDLGCARNEPSFLGFIANSPLGQKAFGMKHKKSKFLLMNKIPSEPIEVDLISGSFILMKRELFNYMEGLDPNTFLYYEENILMAKLKRFGFTLLFVPSAEVVHYHGASTSLQGKVLSQKASLKSMMYYLKNYKKYNYLQRIFIKTVYQLSILMLLLKKQI